MLPDSELDAIRTEMNKLLPGTCAIHRPTLTSDGKGGFTTAWGTVTASVACLISSSRNRQENGTLGGRDANAVDYYVMLPAATDVTAQDRLVSGTRTFEVSQVQAISFEGLRRCLAKEIK